MWGYHRKESVFSDGWTAYNGLSALGYNHGVVIHKMNFLNPGNREIHTQTVERLNRTLKEFLPATSNSQLLDSHIHQFSYFYRLVKFSNNLFQTSLMFTPDLGKLGSNRLKKICVLHICMMALFLNFSLNYSLIY
jgi:hypothetical protein